MFQRLDKLRKNAFSSVILFGSNNDSTISGIWVFRGQELAFPVSLCADRGCAGSLAIPARSRYP